MQSIHSGVGETKQVQSTGGHLRQNKTHERVSKRYYCPRGTQDVANFINSCHKCQVVKEVHLQKANTKLHSVVVPNKTWCQRAIDLTVGLRPGPYGHRNIHTSDKLLHQMARNYSSQDKDSQRSSIPFIQADVPIQVPWSHYICLRYVHTPFLKNTYTAM